MSIIRHTITIVIVAIFASGMFTLWWRGDLDVAPPSTKEVATVKNTDEDEKALALLIWHTAGKGDGVELTKKLVGVAALNYRRDSGKTLSTIFTEGLIMLPKSIPASSLRLYSLFPAVLSLTEVRGEAAVDTGYPEAQLLAHALLEADKKGDLAAELPQEHRDLACVKKLIRSFSGLLGPRIVGGWETLQTEMRAEFKGHLVYKDPDGAEFFCPK